MRRLASALALLSLILASRNALPCGPGIHILESSRLIDTLAASDEGWAQVASTPMARSYLALGSISPDFQWATSYLPFGHDFGLSYHLREAAAAKGPLFQAFALGHLSHVTASDPACEMFIAPTLVASVPLGVLDLTTSDDDNRGEAEGLFEVFGDLVLGDWDTLVDVLYDFWMDGDDAKARGQEVFTWYCTEGAAYTGLSVDCAAAWAEFSGLLGQAEGLLGDQDRDAAREFLHSIVDQPLTDLAAMFTGGFFQELLGGRLTQSDNFDREFQRFVSSPAVTEAFWQPYLDSLYLLGPTWAVQRENLRNTGFPSWSGNALVCGNIQSMMQFLPGAYQVVPGLIVDGLWWKDAGGTARTRISAADQGSAMTLSVQFFSAYPFTGKVIARIRKDRPGLDPTDDPIVAEGDVSVAIDPLAYVTTPRSTLEVPFTADVSGALGLYAELWVEGASGPWFTTSWDRLWTLPDVDVDRPAIRNNFGTYGFWPPSLRIDPPDVLDSTLFVKAHVAPAGGGIDRTHVEAESTVGDATRIRETGWNGVAVFEQAGTQPLRLHVTAPGFAPAATVEAQPIAYQDTWVRVPMHGIPQVALPSTWLPERACVPFVVAADPFQGQVARFLSKARTQEAQPVESETVEAVPGKASRACFAADLADGTRVVVAATPRYLDDSTGIEGVSLAAGIDGSAPGIGTPDVGTLPGGPCGEADRYKPFEVAFAIAEPHSPVTAFEWRIGDGEWAAIDGVLAPGEIARFVEAVNPLDRAGAYTVDGPGSLLVQGYRGCYQNVLGFPMVRLDMLLRELGVFLFERMDGARAVFL